MSFLSINGVVVPVANGQATLKTDLIGAGLTRAQDGSARDNWQDEKQHLVGKTIPMAQKDALFLHALLRGKFDRVQPSDATFKTDKGLVPSATTNCTYQAAGGWFGNGGILVGATTGSITWTGLCRSGRPLTLFVVDATNANRWELTWNAAGVLTGVWKNGVQQALVLPGWLAVNFATGAVTISNTTGAAVSYSEVIAVIAEESGTNAAAFAAWINTTQPPQAPKLSCSGDFYPSALTMLGQPGDGSYIQGAVGGAAFANNNLQIAFDLLEA